MKDSCRLIQDLYPLYIEDELSPPVKKMVDEHLNRCSTCQQIYETGEGFGEEMTDEHVEVPTTLDDRVKLKLKFRRMKFIAAILAVIIGMMLFNSYENSRQEVINWTDDLYRNARHLTKLVESAKHENIASLKFNEQLYANQAISDLDSFNWLERIRLLNTKYLLNIKKQELYTALETLHHKQEKGKWDEVDTVFYNQLKTYSYDYMNKVEDEYQKFHHGYSSYIQMVDFKRLDQLITEINELAYFYNRFHLVPKDVERLSDDEVKQRIGKIFSVNPDHVRIESNTFLGDEIGLKSFEVEQQFIGEIDVFTGMIMHYNSRTQEDQKKDKQIDEKDAQKIASDFLQVLFEENAEFNFKYKGEEGHRDHHVFDFKPVNSSIPLLDVNENLVDFVIKVNEQTGSVDSLMITRTYLDKQFFNKKFIEHLSHEEGLKRLNEFIELEDAMFTVKRRYKYVESYVIPSRLTGEYELVHAYELLNKVELNGQMRNKETRFINAETGKEEFKYELAY